MTAPRWTTTPAILQLLQKLQELSARLARLEALEQTQRTHAVIRALTEAEQP